jgi:accessory gene regulator B
MVNKLGKRLTNTLINNNQINESERCLYEYGFFILLSNVIYVTITLILGSAFNIIIESMAFYIAFSLIRRYAGGFHASSEMKCTLITTISIFLCLLCTKLCETNNIQMPILVLTGIATVLIFVLCPLDTPEKPLTKEEYKYFRKISWVILLLIMLAICIGIYFKLEFLMYPCCMSLILESILLVLGKIKRLIKK